MPNLKTDLEKESGDILTSSKPFLICITMPFNLPTNLTIHPRIEDRSFSKSISNLPLAD